MCFLLDEDLALMVLENLSEKSPDYGEVRLQIDEGYHILVRNGVLEVYGYGIEKGISVRTLVNGSMGFATTDNLSDDELKRIAEHSYRLAASQGKGSISLSEEKPVNVHYEVKEKEKFENVAFEDKMETLLNIDKVVASLQNGVKIPSRTLSLTYTVTSKIIVNTDGSIVRSVVPRIHLMGYFVLAKGERTMTRMVSLGEARGWEAINEWNPSERIANNLRDLSKVLEEAKEVEDGNYDIILGSETSGLAAHESCGHPFELDRILGREGAQAGESFVTVDMLGKRIASEEVTVIDDPTLPHSYGFYLYDEEAVAARPRYLIYKGVINEFLMNRETANVLGLNSNAAARASAYNREPIVRMANTYFAPGSHTFEELLEDIKKGIYIKSFGEWNIDDRRYNMRFVGLEAYYIENGEIKHPLWNPIFEITTPKFYESIDAVDRELHFDPATCGKSDPGQGVPVFTGGPNLRVRNVHVSKHV